MNEEFQFPDEVENKKSGGDVDEIEIEIVDDTPERDRGRKPLGKTVEDPTDDELTTYSDKVQTRIKELTHARHDERREKEKITREKDELERAAAKLWEDNRRLRAFADAGSKQVGESTRFAAEAAMKAARQKFKEAQDAFDTEAIMDAQEAMTDAKWRLEAAKNFRPTSLQTQEDAVQPQYSEPAATKPDEKSLRWQARNQWFGADGFEEVTSYALGLHQKLVKSGVDARSDDYYDTLNGRLKDKFPEVFGEEERQRSNGTPRKPTSVVAPAARSTGPRKIKLSISQVNAAKKLGVTPQQYALEVAKLEAQNG
jgi:hypothetical protein